MARRLAEQQAKPNRRRGPGGGRRRTLFSCQEVLLTLVYLRHNVSHAVVGQMFGVSARHQREQLSRGRATMPCNFADSTSEVQKRKMLMASSQKIAEMISSIVNSTRYSHEIWVKLTDEEKEEIIVAWATLIRNNPKTAADEIVHNILAHPKLGEAWQKLAEIDGLTMQPNSFKYLVSLLDN